MVTGVTCLRRTSTGLLLTIPLLVLPPFATAQIRASAPVFIVNLEALDRGITIVRASTLDEALRKMQPAAAGDAEKPGDRLDSLMASCRPDPDGKPKPATEIVTRLYECADCVAAYRETRFLTQRGDTIALIVLYDGVKIKNSLAIRAFFAETPRESELIATAKALRNLIQQETQRLAKGLPTCIAFTHTLQHKRSHLKSIVTVAGSTETLTSAPSTSVLKQPSAAAAGPPAGERHESASVTLGPEERWFFSADFSISKASVDIGKEPTVPKELIKSKDFFVALNFALGDLLPDRANPLARRSLRRELLVKIQVLPSREPWTAWAAGVGLRGYRIKTILWNLDVVHPYVTVGRQSVDGEAKWRVAAGLGFDPRSLQKGS